MIKSIRLRNFKSYIDSGSISCAPLTILVGCNNAGKSSILHSIYLLSQSLREPSNNTRLVTKGEYVDLGGYFDILYGRGFSNNRKLSIELERELDDNNYYGTMNEVFSNSSKFSLTLKFNKNANMVCIDKASFFNTKEKEILSYDENGDWNSINISSNKKKYLDFHLLNFLPGLFPKVPNKRNKRTLNAFEEALETMISIQSMSHSWKRLLTSILRVPPHRSHVPFYSGLGERTRSDGGLSGANLIQALASEENMASTGKTLLDSVSESMEELGAISNVKLEALDQEKHIKSLVADDPQGAKDVNVAAMGEGISQMLPVVAATLRTEKNSILLIEQPEIHLHPALQGELADLFVKSVKRGNRQYFVETHSEHLLLRLRTHVAKGDFSPQDLSILYVEKSKGSSKVRRLNLNDRGHFDDWPDGFFDEAYQEAMALAMAQHDK